MSNAIIVHGAYGRTVYHNPDHPNPSNDHWLPWLQGQLIARDILANTPEMPAPWKPVYSEWCHEFERFDIGPQTLLAGHSYGGGFVLRWLSEHPGISTGKVLLVAPSIDPGNTWNPDFFDFTIDSQLPERTASLTVFSSTNDFDNVQKSLALIRQALPDATYREFTDHGHFMLQDLHTSEFPPLLEALL